MSVNEEGLKWFKSLSRAIQCKVIVSVSFDSIQQAKSKVISSLALVDCLKWLDSLSLEDMLRCQEFLLNGLPQENQLFILKVLQDRWTETILKQNYWDSEQTEPLRIEQPCQKVLSLDEGLTWFRSLSRAEIRKVLESVNTSEAESESEVKNVGCLRFEDGMERLKLANREEQLACHAFLLNGFPKTNQIIILRELSERWMSTMIEQGSKFEHYVALNSCQEFHFFSKK